MIDHVTAPQALAHPFFHPGVMLQPWQAPPDPQEAGHALRRRQRGASTQQQQHQQPEPGHWAPNSLPSPGKLSLPASSPASHEVSSSGRVPYPCDACRALGPGRITCRPAGGIRIGAGLASSGHPMTVIRCLQMSSDVILCVRWLGLVLNRETNARHGRCALFPAGCPVVIICIIRDFQNFRYS